MKKPFSEMYHLYVEGVEALAQEKLGRPLIESEHRCIWNMGSLLFLEVFERGLLTAQTVEEVIALLAEQVPLSEERLRQTRVRLREKVTELLQRSLSELEDNTLRTIETVEDALHIAEQITDASSNEREAIFQRMITNRKTAK